MAVAVTFDSSLPAIAQNDPWSCAPTSLRWALTALGLSPDEQTVEANIQAEDVASMEDGLLNATGAGLAAFIRRHWGEFGIEANHEPFVAFDFVALEGGHAYPLLIGGRTWGHWSGVRGYNRDLDVLELANPANMFKGVGQTMTRTQFANLGPFSMVRVYHPDVVPA